MKKQPCNLIESVSSTDDDDDDVAAKEDFPRFAIDKKREREKKSQISLEINERASSS